MAEDASEKARKAIIELIDAGEKPTARAVRERARVGMQIAADAVSAWRASQSDDIAVPDMPESVQIRLAAIWRAAYLAADAINAPARDEIAEHVADLTAERDGLLGDVADLERRLDALTAERDRAVADHSASAIRLEDALERIADLEKRAREADRLTGQLEAAKEQVYELREQLRAADADR